MICYSDLNYDKTNFIRAFNLQKQTHTHEHITANGVSLYIWDFQLAFILALILFSVATRETTNFYLALCNSLIKCCTKRTTLSGIIFYVIQHFNVIIAHFSFYTISAVLIKACALCLFILFLCCVMFASFRARPTCFLHRLEEFMLPLI